MYITLVYPDAEQVGCLFLEHHPRGFGTVPIDDHIIIIIIHKHNITRTRAHTHTHTNVYYMCVYILVCVFTTWLNDTSLIFRRLTRRRHSVCNPIPTAAAAALRSCARGRPSAPLHRPIYHYCTNAREPFFYIYIYIRPIDHFCLADLVNVNVFVEIISRATSWPLEMTRHCCSSILRCNWND